MQKCIAAFIFWLLDRFHKICPRFFKVSLTQHHSWKRSSILKAHKMIGFVMLVGSIEKTHFMITFLFFC